MYAIRSYYDVIVVTTSIKGGFFMFEETKYCAELSERLLSEMISDGYSPKSVDHHIRHIYNSLAKFCSERFDEEYSVQAGKAFMAMIQSYNFV